MTPASISVHSVTLFTEGIEISINLNSSHPIMGGAWIEIIIRSNTFDRLTTAFIQEIPAFSAPDGRIT